MNFIELYLAKIIDTFKASNPKIYAAVVLGLGTIIYLCDNGLGDIVGAELAEVVKYTSIVLGLLTGSRTTAILKENKEV
jgi:hypothetical protein